jgi:hypothetical protein
MDDVINLAAPDDDGESAEPITNTPAERDDSDEVAALEPGPRSVQFDLEELRLDQDLDSLVAADEVLSQIPARRPNRHWFVRVRPGDDWCFRTHALTFEDDRDDIYFVTKSMVEILREELKPVALWAAITTLGASFAWPTPIPDPVKPNRWHQSGLSAVEAAKAGWVSVRANKQMGLYVPVKPRAAYPEPKWPDITPVEFFRIAMGDRVIRSADHPIVKRLFGLA